MPSIRKPGSVSEITGSLGKIVSQLESHEAAQTSIASRTAEQIVALTTAKTLAESEAEKAKAVKEKINALIS